MTTILVRKKPQAPRWNAETTRVFFAEMAQTANIRHSARVAGMSEAGAHRKKRDDPAFRRRWLAALAEGYAQIELLLLQRAVASLQDAPVGIDGSKAAEMSDRMLVMLYTTHRETMREYRAAEAGQAKRDGDRDEDGSGLSWLEAKLDEMHERLADEA